MQPVAITNIALSEVMSIHQHSPGTITVKTACWGECTYPLDTAGHVFIRAVLNSVH